MTKETIYKPSDDIVKNALISQNEFENLYKESINNPTNFWAEQALNYLTWDQEWEEVKESNLTNGKIRWFKGAKLNASEIGRAHV